MNRQKILWFALMLSVMVIIFYFSNQNGTTSHAFSNMIARILKIEGTEWEEPSAIPLLFNFSLRKWAHLVLYGILGLTAWECLKSVWKSFGACCLYSCLDEIHQLFISGRGASATDTLIDALGFGIVIMVCFAVSAIYNQLKRKKL